MENKIISGGNGAITPFNGQVTPGNGQVTDCQKVKLPMPRVFNGKKYYGAADVAKIIGVSKKNRVAVAKKQKCHRPKPMTLL